MTYQLRFGVWGLNALFAGVGVFIQTVAARDVSPVNGPDPRENPIPRIETPVGRLPSVKELAVREEMPEKQLVAELGGPGCESGGDELQRIERH